MDRTLTGHIGFQLEKEMKRFASLAGLALLPFAASANMVVNGNFEAGNTGFTTSYLYIDYDLVTDPLYGTPPGTPANASGQGMYDDGRYTITNVQPKVWHDLWRNNVDLTGHGWYMLFNGSTAGNSNVWSQNVTGLQAGQQYELSFDIFTAFAMDNERADLDINVGGVNVGSVIAPSGSSQWETLALTFTFNGSSDLVSILNVETAFSGNDFGIDNVAMNPVPEPTTLAVSVLGIAALLRRRRSLKG